MPANPRSKPNARTIGLFVIAGICLFFAGIIAFSKADLFSRKQKYVMYFGGSLKGLDVGSPVSFRGVSIGRVINIVMELDRDKGRITTPVYVEIEPDKFKVDDGLSLLAEPPIKKMVESGLRAQLKNQSLITGQMYIELEFHRNSPPEFKAGEKSSIDEIPTIPSPLDQVQDTLKTVLEKVRTLELEKLVTTASDTMTVTHQAIKELLEVTQKVNSRIDPIMDNIDATSGAGHETLKELQVTLRELNQTVDRAGKMFASIDREVNTLSPTMHKAADNSRNAFEEITFAMRAMRELADYLQRNPDAILTGKQNRERR